MTNDPTFPAYMLNHPSNGWTKPTGRIHGSNGITINPNQTTVFCQSVKP